VASTPQLRLALVLHAHLPWVRHASDEDVLEEAWLTQAIAECYLPLIDVFETWHRDGVRFALTLSVSPTLAAMLDDGLLRERVERRLGALARLAESECRRHREDAELRRLAQLYLDRFTGALARYRALDADLLSAVARVASRGGLELVTTAATHAFLPSLKGLTGALHAQLRTGLAQHTRRFGAPPAGFWLPECGWLDEVGEILHHDLGVRWTVVETHGLAASEPPAVRGPYAPIVSPSGLVVFARDPESSRQVWSAESGFPGDPVYREFHRDLGLEHDLRPFLDPGTADGRGFPTGIKYHAVTDRNSDRKRRYDPDAARARAHQHATEFVDRCLARAPALAEWLRMPPLLVTPFDAELFGHWWYEGPVFLDALVREAHRRGGSIELTTPSAYLENEPTQQLARPSESSWGAGGYSASWLDPANSWAVREVRDVAERMERLARERGSSADPATRRALRQAGREALLSLASDWSFMLSAGTVGEYAERRIREHRARFARLEKEIESDAIDLEWLDEAEASSPELPEFDPRWFAGRATP